MYTAVGRYSVIFNLDKWNSLPKDIQDQIMSVSGINYAATAGRLMMQAGDMDAETLCARGRKGR